MSYTRVTSPLDPKLIALRDDVLRLSHRADQALDHAMRALQESDGPQAQKIINDDVFINHLRYEIEQHCYRLLLLQGPISRDLRSVIAALHIIGELERIADYAVGIAKLTLRMEQSVILKPTPKLLQLHQLAKTMLAESMQAYVEWDVDKATLIMQRDAQADALDKLIGEELIQQMQAKPQHIQSGTYMIWIAHNLERIADRVVGICERVVFMATGEIQEKP